MKGCKKSIRERALRRRGLKLLVYEALKATSVSGIRKKSIRERALRRRGLKLLVYEALKSTSEGV